MPSEVKGSKTARLSYEILRDEDVEAGEPLRIALVKIRLYTGRHHQIRVQMANAGMSLLGDRKYGDETAREISLRLGIRELALCAYCLSFDHPGNGKRLRFEIEPEGRAFHILKP